jgi:two-component system, chemotaxis family, chemotaxis protein CheY
MPRALIVDDSDHIRHLLTMTLKVKGIEVTATCDGREGLDALRSHGPFDLIITDIDMPVMNGFELLEAIRDELGADAPPCLVLSGEPREVRDRALALGAKEVMVKPFEVPALLAIVEQHLKKS